MGTLLAFAVLVSTSSFASSALHALPYFVVSVARAPDGHGMAMEIHAVVEAPIDAVDRVLQDVDTYPRWMPHLKWLRLRPGEPVFEAVYGLPWPMRDVHEVVQTSRTESDGTVRWAWWQVEGDMRRNEGSWDLVSRTDGRTDVTYRGVFELRRWVPEFLVRHAQEASAPSVIRNLERCAQEKETGVGVGQ
jgi:hypothetical protein